MGFWLLLLFSLRVFNLEGSYDLEGSSETFKSNQTFSSLLNSIKASVFPVCKDHFKCDSTVYDTWSGLNSKYLLASYLTVKEILPFQFCGLRRAISLSTLGSPGGKKTLIGL